eukprot:3485163-Amphidinium_carterae.2
MQISVKRKSSKVAKVIQQFGDWAPLLQDDTGVPCKQTKQWSIVSQSTTTWTLWRAQFEAWIGGKQLPDVWSLVHHWRKEVLEERRHQVRGAGLKWQHVKPCLFTIKGGTRGGVAILAQQHLGLRPIDICNAGASRQHRLAELQELAEVVRSQQLPCIVAGVWNAVATASSSGTFSSNCWFPSRSRPRLSAGSPNAVSLARHQSSQRSSTSWDASEPCDTKSSRNSKLMATWS